MIEARPPESLTCAVVGSEGQFRREPEPNRLFDAIEMLIGECQ